MTTSTFINEDYAMELTILYRYRDLADGLSVIEFDCNFDWYHGDHCPKFNLSLRLFNWTIFEFNIYNRHHVVDEIGDVLLPWAKQDFEESDKAFIELVKNSGIVANEGSKPQIASN